MLILVCFSVPSGCAANIHGSGQHKYAYEMLDFLRLTTTDAASPELQRAILANGLVNTAGNDDSWLRLTGWLSSTTAR